MLFAFNIIGDPAAEKIISSAASILGKAIAGQLNNYPVDKLAVSGEILKFGSCFQNLLQKSIESELFSSTKEYLQFCFPPSSSDDTLAIGASMLAAENYVAAFDRITDPAE